MLAGMRLQTLLRLILLALWLCTSMPTIAAPLAVRYPVQSAGYEYPIHLLDLALRKSGISYSLQAVNTPMLQGRALKQLAADTDIDVAWSMTSAEREAELTPIRIPIDKGLLGWRIFLIHNKDTARFAQVKTLADLQRMEAGQGHDWPDTEILRANGLKVQGYPVFESLFNMLQAGRFDYFPRSIMEIWGEEKAHPGMDLVVEQSLILHYPTAYYFFVNKNSIPLAAAIEKGLKRAMQDGSFDTLFNQTYGDVVQRTRLQSRKRLELSNPLLPAKTPLNQKELWLTF
jgi:ABC-type amino acid transport substrate-binding protein